MERESTTLPEVWVITGIGDYDYGRTILEVTPSIEDAERAMDYYASQGYDDVERECFTPATFKPVPFFWTGSINFELRPTEHPDVYTMGQSWGYPSKVYQGKEFYKYRIITEEDSEKGTSKTCCFSFITQEDVPSPSQRKEFRCWVRDKINSLGKIKIVVPFAD